MTTNSTDGAPGSAALATTSSGPLIGVEVLEYGTAAGSSFCGLLLSQLGAHVVKLIGGRDGATGSGELLVKARHAYYDRAKELVGIDEHNPRFVELLGQADVLLSGLDYATPDTVQTLREQLATWRERRPELVCAALTPFGLDPPRSERVGSDLNAQAISGWTASTGNADAPPLSVMYDVCVMQQGLAAAGAVTAALVDRGSEPGGDLIDVSEAEVLAADIRMYSGSYRGYDIAMTRSGHRAPGSSGRYPHTVLPCNDGLVVLICRSDVEWDRFIEMIGSPNWASQPRYRDFYAMATEYPDEVDALLIEWLQTRTKQEITELATRYRVPVAPVRTVDETLEDIQMRHRGFFHPSADGAGALPGLPALWTHIEPPDTATDNDRRRLWAH